VNREQIQQLIPHRDPFLWLDEVTERTDSRIVARKLLSPDLPVFQGHYPKFPVFPGVLQCEACFQAGAVLIAGIVPTGTNEVPVVTRLNNVQSVEGKVTARLDFVCSAAEAPPGM